MEQKEVVIQNKGMNRDLSISKAGESGVLENHNIRILVRDKDTSLSVTNERGNKPIEFLSGPARIEGELVGWNVLNNHIIVFTHGGNTEEAAERIAEAEATLAQHTAELQVVLDEIAEFDAAIQEKTALIDQTEGKLDRVRSYGTVLAYYRDDVISKRNFHWDFFGELFSSISDIHDTITTYPTDEQWEDIDYEFYELEEYYPSAYPGYDRVEALYDDVRPKVQAISRYRPGDTIPSVTEEDYDKIMLYYRVAYYILEMKYEEYDAPHVEEWRAEIEALKAQRAEKYPVRDEKQGIVAADTEFLENLREEYAHMTKADRVYRIDYDGENFNNNIIFEGNLDFDAAHPIESVVYYETESIQKIYWVDGKNVLRFMNFMDEEKIAANWDNDNTAFDSNRAAKFDVECEITKDNAGNPRANGVAQYLLTYYNNHGQETNYVWISDLVYLSPTTRGGAADEQNNNRVTLKFSNMDSSFSHFRVYLVMRSMLDGQTVAYLVSESKTPENGESVSVVDDGAHLTLQDSTRLLYLGSQPVIAGTITHKDNTLFLGDIKSTGKRDYEALEDVIRRNMFVDYAGGNFEAKDISFYTDDGALYPKNNELYPYKNQLEFTSSQILSFKGNEKYRFALKFQYPDGTETESFWIGDKTNTTYPEIENNVVKRVCAVCALPEEVVKMAHEIGLATVQLMIAEATYADRSVKAQGFLNPTVFNTWDRYNERTYAYPSWITRPRNAGYAFNNFEPIHNSTDITGEIDCNYWDDGTEGPEPFYQIRSKTDPTFKTDSEFCRDYKVVGSGAEYDYRLMAFFIEKRLDGFMGSPNGVAFTIYIFSIKMIKTTNDDIDYLKNYSLFDLWREHQNGGSVIVERDVNGTPTPCFQCDIIADYMHSNDHIHTDENLYTLVCLRLHELGVSAKDYPEHDAVVRWEWYATNNKTDVFYNYPSSGNIHYLSLLGAINHTNGRDEYGSPADNDFEGLARFINYSSFSDDESSLGGYTPSFATKNFMFIDENVVTLNSPEITYKQVNIDNTDFKLRIIGVASVDNNISDYTIDIENSHQVGDNVIKANLSKIGIEKSYGRLVSWPIVSENGLAAEPNAEKDYKKRDSADYSWASNTVYYWMRIWSRSGTVSGYSKEGVEDEGILKSKVFGNLHYSHKTKYFNSAARSYTPGSIRQFNNASSNILALHVDESLTATYEGNPEISLSMPWQNKYPILYSRTLPSTGSDEVSGEAFLYSSIPITMRYNSGSHAVISLPAGMNTTSNLYELQLLPYIPTVDSLSALTDISVSTVIPTNPLYRSGAILPWKKYFSDTDVPNYKSAVTHRDSFEIDSDSKLALRNKQYVLIGEIYEDFSEEGHIDSRYGGTTESDIANNRFVAAGPVYCVDDLYAEGENYSWSQEYPVEIIANQGDTYFQRWDCLKTWPVEGEVSGLVDICSVMLETHINLDGRTDNQRGSKFIASIDPSRYGQLNAVYSQQNKFKVSRDLPEDFSTDAYRSSLTWTMQKTDMASIDEWTHLTLANTLSLDGDKGIIRSLRRFQNSIIAFQDRGISEVMFNSRTQLATNEGVPVELANSGKVDGKYYISNKYGCINKFSITEGKNGLYFVDGINKSFCSVSKSKTGRFEVDSLSASLGFSAWFRDHNSINIWTIDSENSIVSFFDKVHSDIYLVRYGNEDMDSDKCLVYNEDIGVFVSFYDYYRVPMMANVEDRFVSFKDHTLWLQNEGLYCNFFGEQYPFWAHYRVSPGLGERIWTNIDYRADFYDVLKSDGSSKYNEFDSLSYIGDEDYQPNETFDSFRVWNEYQSTGDFYNNPIKKFRIWRIAIPRALKTATNKWGLDRIRNPWINFEFRKKQEGEKAQELVQLHDITFKYFE